MSTAIIPTIGASPYLPSLVNSLLDAGVEDVTLVDNFSMERERLPEHEDRIMALADSGRVIYARRPGQNIYRTWNAAMDTAARTVVRRESEWQDDPADKIVHVLNDDLILPPSSIEAMSGALRSDTWAILGYDYLRTFTPLLPEPWEVDGTYRKRGVGGFAFAVRADLCARVDGRFVWWGGDDDLVYRTRAQGGKVGVLMGATVEHPEPSHSADQYPIEHENWPEHDRALMRELWGESW